MAASMQREIGLFQAIALVVGEVIAVGIFLTPAEMIKSLGSPVLVLLIWLAMAVMAVSGALCYGELASRFPQPGGGYVYLREAFGPAVSFLYGWKCFLVMDPGLTAALAVGMASYVAYLVPLSSLGVKCVAVAAILSLGAINIAGLRLGVCMMQSLTVLKLALITTLISLAFTVGKGDWANFAPLPLTRGGIESVIPGLLGGSMAAFFSFGGWWDLSKLGGEVREPQRTLPLAFVTGVVVVTLVYIATSAAFIYLVAPDRVISGEAFAAQVGQILFGRMGAVVFASVVVISVLGSLAGFMLAAPRVYYAMARDGGFFNAVARLHPTFGTPALAIGLQAALACVLVALGNFNEIIAYFIFVTVAFLGLTVLGLFVLRVRSAGPDAFKTPGFPATPLIFLALVVVLLGLLGARKPLQASLGVAVVLAGVPVYNMFFRRRSTTSGSGQTG